MEKNKKTICGKSQGARTIFILKSKMIETKANVKGQGLNDVLCEICGKEETTQHRFQGEGYTEIRKQSERKIHQ